MTTALWNDEMFSTFQCEMGLIFHLKTGKNPDMVDKYLADAEAQMTEDEFVAMMQRIANATA